MKVKNIEKKQKFINFFDDGERERLPFNWCDKWCERCEKSYKCQVFRKEQERILEHSAAGRDPHDPDVIIEDIGRDFEKMQEIIEKDMKKRGMDYRKIMKEVEKIEFEFANLSNFEIIKKCEKYMHRARLFVDVLYRRMQFNPYLDKKIKNDIEVLNWYHTILPVKFQRVLDSLCGAKTKNGEDDVLFLRDAYWTAEVVFKSINLSKNALESILVHEPGSENAANNLFIMLQEIENELIKIADIAFGKHLRGAIKKQIISHQYN